ncbi:MAG: hypothetical protein ABIG44_00500 [Planctomycetota bacterium]
MAGLFCGGCLSWLMPLNIEAVPVGERVTILEGPRARLQLETGLDEFRLREPDLTSPELDEAYWLRIERASRDGTVGGYISSLDDHNGALVLLFDGAATTYRNGGLETAISYYDVFGKDLRDAGFMTWAVVLPEYDTSYGDADLADALEVLDWLESGGREFLGIERIYVVGYSSGATVVNLLNLEREVDAMVSLGGLTQPNQLVGGYWFYVLLSGMFAHNAGYGQLGQTMLEIAPGSPTRNRLDVVSRLEEFRSPMLFIHGTLDAFYLVDNTRALEARYRALRAAGVADLVELDFHYIPNGVHFELRKNPAVRVRIIDYLMQFEPGAGN